MTPTSRMKGDTAPVAGDSEHPTQRSVISKRKSESSEIRRYMYYAFWALRLYYCHLRYKSHELDMRM